jgi:hypothetical protein
MFHAHHASDQTLIEAFATRTPAHRPQTPNPAGDDTEGASREGLHQARENKVNRR